MPFLSKEQLVNLKNTSPNTSVYHTNEQGTGLTAVFAQNIDEAKADEILANDLSRTLARRQLSKYNRPWEIVNITAALDPNEPWLGFEFETGFNTKEQYDSVINHVWHNYNNVAFDVEGFGNWCPEITYPPQELSKYMRGESYIQKTIAFLDANKIKMPDFQGHYVGTHLNLSTPAFRTAGRDMQSTIRDVINNSLLMLNQDEMTELFGRRMYGAGNLMTDWIEFKMFKSTDDPAVFAGYVEVGKRMAELMEFLARKKITLKEQSSASHHMGTTYIYNLYAILSGKTAAEDAEFRYTASCTVGGARAWRYHGYTYETHRERGVKYAAAA